MGYSKAKWHKDGWMIMHNSMLNSQSWLIAIKSGVELQSIISTTWSFFQKSTCVVQVYAQHFFFNVLRSLLCLPM